MYCDGPHFTGREEESFAALVSTNALRMVVGCAITAVKQKKKRKKKRVKTIQSVDWRSPTASQVTSDVSFLFNFLLAISGFP